jgi:hypothetical protein
VNYDTAEVIKILAEPNLPTKQDTYKAPELKYHIVGGLYAFGCFQMHSSH